MENVIFLFLKILFQEAKMNVKEILEKIKALREKKGLTQQDMADGLFIQRVTYTQVELGKIELSLQRFFKICEVLGVTPEFFLFGETDGTKVLISEIQKILDDYKNGN